MPRQEFEPESAPGTRTTTGTRTRWIWWTHRALLLHLTIVIVVPAFAGLFWWQVQRVREGNTLSWAYVFEWPIFIGYAIYLWWKLVHDQDPGIGRAAMFGGTRRAAAAAEPRRRRAPKPCDVGSMHNRGDEEEDEELAAYNRYLASLHATGRQKRW